MYADDTVLLYSHSSPKNIEETLTQEGEYLFRWFHENLILNLKPGKTEYVIYGTARNLKSQLPCYVNILGTVIRRLNMSIWV